MLHDVQSYRFAATLIHSNTQLTQGWRSKVTEHVITNQSTIECEPHFFVLNEPSGTRLKFGRFLRSSLAAG